MLWVRHLLTAAIHAPFKPTGSSDVWRIRRGVTSFAACESPSSAATCGAKRGKFEAKSFGTVATRAAFLKNNSTVFRDGARGV